jgi:hypothetical protein
MAPGDTTVGSTPKFWVVSSSESEKVSFPKTVRGIAVRILQRADLIAMALGGVQ